MWVFPTGAPAIREARLLAARIIPIVPRLRENARQLGDAPQR